MHESEIRSFWESHPCGDHMVGGLDQRFRNDHDQFFTTYDQEKYNVESHIPACIDRLEVNGKRVLEIGLGEGAESELLIRRGARWSGIDLTNESVERVRTRLTLRDLPYDEIVQGTVLQLPFPAGRFDLVFSHGVIHHVPDIRTAQAEIRRVLADSGELVIMLYARRSLNYLLAISAIRRAALVLAFPFASFLKDHGILTEHLRNAETLGLREYLRMENFIHKNTDGPNNPYSKVYALNDVRRDFVDFDIVRVHKQFMHAPPLPVHGFPGGRFFGWHLWVHLRPRLTRSSIVSRRSHVPVAERGGSEGGI